jgi:hypothetical protein
VEKSLKADPALEAMTYYGMTVFCYGFKMFDWM